METPPSPPSTFSNFSHKIKIPPQEIEIPPAQGNTLQHITPFFGWGDYGDDSPNPFTPPPRPKTPSLEARRIRQETGTKFSLPNPITASSTLTSSPEHFVYPDSSHRFPLLQISQSVSGTSAPYSFFPTAAMDFSTGQATAPFSDQKEVKTGLEGNSFFRKISDHIEAIREDYPPGREDFALICISGAFTCSHGEYSNHLSSLKSLSEEVRGILTVLKIYKVEDVIKSFEGILNELEIVLQNNPAELEKFTSQFLAAKSKDSLKACNTKFSEYIDTLSRLTKDLTSWLSEAKARLKELTPPKAPSESTPISKKVKPEKQLTLYLMEVDSPLDDADPEDS